VIVGGGIAGLATAWELARRGARVLLLEQEALLASHSTARNAAIWLPTEIEGTSPALTRRSAELLDELVGREGWLDPIGAVVTASDAALLGTNAAGAAASGARVESIDVETATRLAPALSGGSTRAALYVPEAGVLDIHAMTDAVTRAARDAGVTIRTGVRVRRIVRDDPRSATGTSAHDGVVTDARVTGVVLQDGTRIDAGLVVIAGGAWAGALGASCGAPIAATPLRRHLVIVEAEQAAREPVVWNVGKEVYYRPESGGLLASPCDEDPIEACTPPADGSQLDVLATRLTALAPALGGARVRRVWACLRTYTPDRELVAGPDPRAPGLAWLAGLGGRGMTIGLAAAELTAALVAGEESPFRDAVSPARASMRVV
jgi:D-arginine dehydrogenase